MKEPWTCPCGHFFATLPRCPDCGNWAPGYEPKAKEKTYHIHLSSVAGREQAT